MTEAFLPGGNVNAVRRVGDTVRRVPPARADFVHRLLEHFERVAWPGAPRFLGIDEDGREVLTFLSGHVAWEPTQPAALRSEANLRRIARLVREFHDLTAGTPLAGAAEVVCHNDLAPRNTVYAGPDLHPVAIIDWDLAAAGERIHDLAHACWQYLDLGPSWTDPAAAAHLIGVISDAYGGEADRAALVAAIIGWQDRCWRGIEAGAAAGEPAMVGLRDRGAAREVRLANHWTARHRAELLG